MDQTDVEFRHLVHKREEADIKKIKIVSILKIEKEEA
jgi:hypothetical protein